MARASTRLGITRCLELLPRRNCLIGLNYHRIGDPATSLFDPDVYSATAEDFDRQLSLISKRFAIIGPEEVVEYLSSPHSNQGACVWITFDDGYLDNYELAFPVLKSHGQTATFFLVGGFVGSSEPQWWDRIAYYVRQGPAQFTLDAPSKLDVDIDRGGLALAIRSVIDHFKSPENKDQQGFLQSLRDVCGASEPAANERIYLNWDEAREMHSGGMGIGSHTNTHPILAKLSADEQLEELKTAKGRIETELGSQVISLAYPVGSVEAIGPDAGRMASKAGYQLAASFYGGFNYPGQTDLFDVQRNAIHQTQDLTRVRFQLALGGATGRYWI